MTRPALDKFPAHSLADGAQVAASAEGSGNRFAVEKEPVLSTCQPKKFAGITASAGEVAAALGLNEKSFRRKMRAMHRDLGFPLPLRGGNWTWSTRAVRIWIEAQSGLYAAPATPGAASALDDAGHEDEDEAITGPIVLAQRRDLRRRYGGRA